MESGVIFYSGKYEWRRKLISEFMLWCCNRCNLNPSNKDVWGSYHDGIMRPVVIVYSLFKKGDLESGFYSQLPSEDK